MDFRKIRVNQQIRAPQVRVVDEQGKQLGIMPTQEALQKATELGVDLVEIVSTSNPPVCKLIDFSKFKYLQEKREKELRKQKKLTHLKEIHLTPQIAEHDLQIKIDHIKEFLQHQHGVRVLIQAKKFKNVNQDTINLLQERIKKEFSEYNLNIQHIKDLNKVIILITPKRK